MGKLLLLFIIVPAVELALLVQLGERIGLVATLALIVATGVIGVSLARRQGLGVLRQMQAETASGRLPAGSIFDGVMILIAGALLITPGILTDAVGFACLIPGTRRWMKRLLRRWVERALREGRIHVSGMHVDLGDDLRDDLSDSGGSAPSEPPRRDEEIIDIPPTHSKEERSRR